MTVLKTRLFWAVIMVIPLQLLAQDPYPVDLRIGVQTASTKRNTSLSDAVTARMSATVTGFEATLSGDDGAVGIGGRLLRGSYENGDYSLKEVRGFIGGSWFQIQGAYGQRSLFGTDSMFTFAKPGARLVIPIGGSGVSLTMSGAKYFPADFGGKKTELTKTDGWEGETGLFYLFPVVPLYAQFGYRNEYFRQGTREENLSGLVLGIGLWVGGS